MDVYLLRHGIAEAGALGSPDSERALTTEGAKKVREVLHTAKSAGVKPDLILSSPFKRARQTAEVAAKELGYTEAIPDCAPLVPSGDPRAVWEEIRLHKASSALLLVSHEPLLSATLAMLLNSPALRTEFKKGSLARVEIESFGVQPRGTLRWLLAPRLARK
jgi:phosphohistidine phosphatase